MRDEEPLAALRRAILDGEAMLLLGQDHTPDWVDSILRDAESLLALESPVGSVADLYTRFGDGSARGAIDALMKASPNVGLLEVASLPWTAVLTTAVDPVVLTAMRGAGGQRRVVEVTGSQILSLSQWRSTQVLHLIRAFGSIEGGLDAPVPTSPEALNRVRLLQLPQLVAQLPRLVGLRGFVVVDGISDRDWLGSQGLQTLGLAFQLLPPGRVFWFGRARSTQVPTVPGVHFDNLPFKDHLKQWLTETTTEAAIQVARERVFGVGDRVLTLKGDGQQRRVVIGAREWRDVNRVAQVLDDDTLTQARALPAEGKAGLVKYLKRSHAGMPDWSGPAKGYIFERQTVRALVDEIVTFIEGPKPSILSDARHSLPRRVPYILAGPPASGKTVGLLRAAWELRNAHEVCVLWLVPGVAGVDVVAVERICRILELKGVRWTVLVADGLDLEDYFRLHQRLGAAGRRVLVLGTESTIPGQRHSGSDVRRFELDADLRTEELQAFRRYLNRLGLQADDAVVTTDFLHLLSRAVPEVQFGALPSLVEEYERLIAAVRQSSSETDKAQIGTVLGERLRELFPDLISLEGSGKSHSRFDADDDLRRLLHLILFAAQLERPLPVDIALEVLGSGVLRKFPQFETAFETTALIQDIRLDDEGARGLTTAHQLHAEWLLQGLVSQRAAQLDLLRQLALGIRWAPDAFPGDNPSQDYVLDLLKAVGPRGRFSRLYSFKTGLDRLANIIREVRENFVMEQPRLLALEALILGDLAQIDTENRSERLSRCKLALELLGRAEDILHERRPSEARNFELQRTLTQAADIRGTMVNIWLRQQIDGEQLDVPQILEDLATIQRDAMRARSYDPQYHPLDIVCWSHKDAVDWLPDDVDPAIREGLLAAIESALEVAEEEGIRDSAQLGRYQDRKVQAAERRGNSQISEALAHEMRERGDFAGEVSISRYRLGGDASPQTCLMELQRFWEWRPTILKNLYAVRYMQHLWIRAFLRERLGEGAPKQVGASRSEWELLANVCRARLAFEEDHDQPFTLFLLGWSLYQLGEAREARRAFERLERQSLGMARRVGELVYLTDDAGQQRSYEAQVVHARTGQVKVRVPALDTVADIRPEVETRISPSGFRMGEIIDISVALNYRGLTLAPPHSHS